MIQTVKTYSHLGVFISHINCILYNIKRVDTQENLISWQVYLFATKLGKFHYLYNKLLRGFKFIVILVYILLTIFVLKNKDGTIINIVALWKAGRLSGRGRSGVVVGEEGVDQYHLFDVMAAT